MVHLTCLNGQVGPKPGRKMVELKVAQLLHQSALRCLENYCPIEFRMAGKCTKTAQKFIFF